MFYLIGIDGTDSPSVNGGEDTASLGIRLGLLLQERRFGRMLAVTRHQLLRRDALPFTAENQACCLLVEADADARRDIELTSREFILRQSAPASDPGFALAAWSNLSAAVDTWGQQAKYLRLQRDAAMQLARAHDISLAGFQGNGNGVIGALAAVGLRSSGNDGQFAWLPGLESLKGTLTLPALLNYCAIDRVENLRGRTPFDRDLIHLGEAPVVLLRGGQSLLLLHSCAGEDVNQWRVYSPVELAEVAP